MSQKSRQNQSQTMSSLKPINQNQQSQSQFISSLSQIQYSLTERINLIQQIIHPSAQSEKYLTSANKYKIVNHCNQYSKIVSIVTNILNESPQNANIMSYEKFWQTNQNLQRQLEQHLRDLKSIDTVIDNIVNQQFDKCNQIDQIQQTIRIILSKKQQNHISKAEPYFQQKQKCLAYLAEKKQQRQKVKQQKLNLIKKILGLLDNLKRHRQTGLRMCTVQEKQKKNQQSNLILLQRSINDFKQIQKNQNQLNNYQNQLSQLLSFINQSQKRIQQYSNALLQLLNQQNQACLQYQSISKLKYETQYFENTLISMFGMQNIKKSNKKQYGNQMQNILIKLQKSLKQNKQKQKQVVKIQQGIQKTKKTIGIFQNILNKIQTQNSRKRNLMKDIQKLQTKHHQQQKNIASISQVQNQIQKMKLKRNQLNKSLDSKVNQANVMAYKSIHQQILKLQNEIKIKIKQIQGYRQSIRENAKKLYDDVLELQKQYEDILSQIMPSIWFKASDLTKQEAIKDLNMYLSKTFKRLSIVD